MNSEITGLEEKLKTTEGMERVDVLNQLAFLNYPTNLDQMKIWATKAGELAETLHYHNGLTQSYRHLGVVFWAKGFYRQSILLAEKSLKICEENDDQDGMASSYNLLGVNYDHQGDYDHALKWYLKTLQNRELKADKTGVLRCYINIGLIYYHLKEYEQALKYQMQIIESIKTFDSPNEAALVYNNIGIIYQAQLKIDDAFHYYHKALLIEEETHNLKGLMRVLTNIAGMYKDQADLDQALQYQQHAIKAAEQLNDPNSLMYCYLNLGIIYSARHDLENAQAYLDKGLELAKMCGAKKYEADANYYLSELYEKENQPIKALAYFKAYHALNIEIFNTEKSEKIAQLQAEYEIEKKERETELYRLKNEELTILNHEKDEILQILAHDLKNPLTTMGLSISILHDHRYHLTPNQYEQKLKQMSDQLQRINEIITKLLNLRTVESGKIKLEPVDVDLRTLISRLCDHFTPAAHQKKITIYPDLNLNSEYLHTDEMILKEILENLISNTIKFSPFGKNVYIRLRDSVALSNGIATKCVRIEIEDEGQGLTEDDLTKIFGKFQKLSAKPTGGEHSTGLGLSIVKKLVEIMNGTVWAESKGKDQGSTFIVELFVV